MIRFIKSLLVFFITLIIFSLVVKVVINTISNYNYSFKLPETTTNLILGHSQTETAFNDKYIDATQNFSQGAEAYLYTYVKLKRLVHSNPKIKNVFLCFSNNQIDSGMDTWLWSYEYMKNMYPKYSFLMTKKEYQELAKRNTMSFLLSEAKAINFFLGSLKTKNANFLNDRRWGGYLELHREKLDSLLKYDTRQPAKEFKISNTNIEYLLLIRDFCKEEGIVLYLVRTPLHSKFPFLGNENQFQQVKNELLPNVVFLDFKDFPIDIKEFGDYHHLNYKGAKKFSLFFNSLLDGRLLNSRNKQRYINKRMQELEKNN